ncbi:hypothetical protein CROQUDRAFT_656796 [Cronartium quercuum f. sp. fusiforme G11]|uniref:Uncharacterized protein n=1 Tax=Cronartium quercuum f. sp. fusiforme G11 TaxID=708437 RepID=A0A9P6NME3_9BASI|nr:hypothetical protein CROQUDRAFT_656796 [Cronartium quercuum f. sp. fusiforme G11]
MFVRNAFYYPPSYFRKRHHERVHALLIIYFLPAVYDTTSTAPLVINMIDASS